MAIAVQSKTADAMLSMGVPSQSGGGANNSQSVQSGQDFGGMVKQKQQEIRQDAAKDGGNGSESEDARAAVRNDGTAVSARQQGQQEIPHEQYILAAALILIPNVGTVTMEAATEETAVAVEVEPAFVADMQIESLTDLPVAEVADESGNAAITVGVIWLIVELIFFPIKAAGSTEEEKNVEAEVSENQL